MQSVLLDYTGYRGVSFSFKALTPPQGFQAFLRGVFRISVFVQGLSWQIWASLIFSVLNSLLKKNTIYSKVNFFFLLCATFLSRFMGAGIQMDNHRTKPGVNHYSFQHIPSSVQQKQDLRLALCRLPFLLDHTKLLMWTHNYLPKEGMGLKATSMSVSDLW